MSLGPYQILSRIGAGGMGEVWRAHDKRIGRDVAVKVLPDVFNEESLKRFEQEARAAGSLSHPGLVTIFDVGTTGDWPYIVMEMLEGETLRDVLGDGDPGTPLPPRKAVDYAAQVAAALAVAHEQGIIHRDLKPENLFITPDRRVKILDFGLAKLASDAHDADGRKRTSAHLTGAGIAVGTPAYMSPEQVRAGRVDQRTDIFSLGAVLYEMLTGRPPFERISAVETMYSVLSSEPRPLEELVPAVSPALAALVHHCLEKDPRERFRSAHDLAFQLRNLPEMLQTNGSGMRAPLRNGKSRPSRTWMIVAPIVLAAAAGGFAVRALRRPEPPAEGRAYKQLTFAEGLETDPAIAPDGKSFAYALAHTGNRDIYVQRVDGRAAINITADSPDDESEPAFSPDGSKIAFRSERDGGGIFVMGVTGELVRRLTKGGHDPSWSPDGTRIVFSTADVPFGPHLHRSDGNLRIVDTRDGTSRLLLDYHRAPGVETDALQPSWSPHGKRIAFWGVSTTDNRRHIWTIDPDAQEPMKTLVRVTSDAALHWNPIWSPDGRFLYYGSDRDGTLNLWRVAIDETTGKPGSERPEPFSLPASFSGSFSISQRGELLFNTLNRSYRLLGLPFDAGSGRTGEPRVLLGGAEEILSFEPSPDGRAVAYTTGGGAQEDVFVANTDGTRLRQLTNDAARDRGVTWSPDGKTLYFYSDRQENYQIWRIQADGSDLAAVTNAADLKRVGASSIYTPNTSPDGRMLVAQTNRDCVFVHLDRPPGQRLERISAPVVLSRWSPDGTRLVGIDSRRQMILYSPKAQRLEQFSVTGSNQHWLPDSRHVATFGEGRVSIVDLATRRLTSSAFTLPPGANINAVRPRLSRDGSTLYLRQMLEQGDVWLMRPGTE